MSFKVDVNVERCKGCALCVEVCPRLLLVMSHALNEYGSHFVEINEQKNCSGCAHCAIICPDAAIEIEKSEDDEEKIQ